MTTMSLTPCQQLHKATRERIAAMMVVVTDEAAYVTKVQTTDEIEMDEQASKFVAENPDCEVYVLKPVSKYSAPEVKPKVVAEIL